MAVNYDRERGSIAYRHNNPGNIKFGPFAERYGASPGEFSPEGDGSRYAYFPDVGVARSAISDLLTGENYRDLPLEDAMRRYSGGGYGIDVVPEDLRDLRLGQLDQNQLNTVVDNIVQREGTFEGSGELNPDRLIEGWWNNRNNNMPNNSFSAESLRASAPPGFETNPYVDRVISYIDELEQGPYGSDPTQAFRAFTDRIVPAQTDEEMLAHLERGNIPFRIDTPSFEEQQFIPTDTTGMESAIDEMVQARIEAAQSGSEGAERNYNQARQNLFAMMMNEVARTMAPSSSQSFLPGAMGQYQQAQMGREDARVRADQQQAIARGEGAMQRAQLLYGVQNQDRDRQEAIDRYNARGRMDEHFRRNQAMNNFVSQLQQSQAREAQAQSAMANYALQFRDWFLRRQLGAYDNMLEWNRRSGSSGGGGIGRLGVQIQAINADFENALNALEEYERLEELSDRVRPPLYKIAGEDRRRYNQARQNTAQQELILNRNLEALWGLKNSLPSLLGQDTAKMNAGDPMAAERVRLYSHYRDLLHTIPPQDAEPEEIAKWLRENRSRLIDLQQGNVVGSDEGAGESAEVDVGGDQAAVEGDVVGIEQQQEFERFQNVAKAQYGMNDEEAYRYALSRSGADPNALITPDNVAMPDTITAGERADIELEYLIDGLGIDGL